MGHDHGHSHGDVANADQRKIAIALALTAAIMVAEIAVGLIAGSIALLADAAHNATDALAIGLALFAARISQRAASSRYTFGLQRSEILSAQANGVGLLVLAAVIGYDSIRRLFDPPEVEAGLVIALGVIGGVVNILAAWSLSRAQRRSLNVEGAMQHVLADLYGSIAAAAAGVAVLATGFLQADPIAALVVVALMLRSGWQLTRDSGRVLLEGAPRGLETTGIGKAMAAEQGVTEVHDLHIWEVTSDFPALSAHVLVGRDTDCHKARRQLERMLHDRFEIEHTTLQVDHEGGELINLEAREQRDSHDRDPTAG